MEGEVTTSSAPWIKRNLGDRRPLRLRVSAGGTAARRGEWPRRVPGLLHLPALGGQAGAGGSGESGGRAPPSPPRACRAACGLPRSCVPGGHGVSKSCSRGPSQSEQRNASWKAVPRRGLPLYAKGFARDCQGAAARGVSTAAGRC